MWNLKYWWPLVGFVVPTLGIGFGYVIPNSVIAGVNELTLGFASTVVGAVITYGMGIRTVVNDTTAPLPPPR